MSNRVLNLNLIQHRPILKLNRNRIANRTFFRVVVIYAEGLLFFADYLCAEFVDAWVGGA